jgi:hypothetical protein
VGERQGEMCCDGKESTGRDGGAEKGYGMIVIIIIITVITVNGDFEYAYKWAL